jgi:hypothetical protein
MLPINDKNKYLSGNVCMAGWAKIPLKWLFELVFNYVVISELLERLGNWAHEIVPSENLSYGGGML